jgi:MoxR-like ATPase
VGGSGNDDERRCELHEFIRGRFDFKRVMSYFFDADLEGATRLETSRAKIYALGDGADEKARAACEVRQAAIRSAAHGQS